MSLRKSQRQPQPKQQPTEEERVLTEQEPDTSTKVAEGSVLEGLYQLRDDNESDPVIKNAAEVLERSRPKLSRKQWYTFLRTVRDGSNLHEDLTRVLNEIATGAAEPPHTERGIVDGILYILQQCIILFQEDSVSVSISLFSWWCSLHWPS